MSTRRAEHHKGLVEYEKKYHHRAGIRLHQNCRIRIRNLMHAVYAESAYEWHKQHRYSEIAQELYDLGPVSIEFSVNPEFAKKLWEALNHD